MGVIGDEFVEGIVIGDRDMSKEAVGFAFVIILWWAVVEVGRRVVRYPDTPSVPVGPLLEPPV
jgi:hypothetical protein